MSAGQCFARVLACCLLGLAAGGGAAAALGLVLPGGLVWVLLAVGVAAGAAGAALALPRPAAPLAAPLTAPLAAPEPIDPLMAPAVREAQKRLRHDVRGALAPALLITDRLLAHQDPAVQRAGNIVVKAVDRAALLLADPAAPGAPSPPAGP